jgi:hypothetical protein
MRTENGWEVSLTLNVDFGVQVRQFLKTRFVEFDWHVVLLHGHVSDDKMPLSELRLDLGYGQPLVFRVGDDLNRGLMSLLKVPRSSIVCATGLDKVLEGLKFIQVLLKL